MKQHVTKTVGIAILFSVLFSSCFAWASEKNPSEKISGVEESVIVINTSFLATLKAKPTIEAWRKNYWEFLYLVSIGNSDARTAGYKLLAGSIDNYDIHEKESYSFLARYLSIHDTFWKELIAMPVNVQKKVIRYYDKNPNDFLGFEYISGRKHVLDN